MFHRAPLPRRPLSMAQARVVPPLSDPHRPDDPRTGAVRRGGDLQPRTPARRARRRATDRLLAGISGTGLWPGLDGLRARRRCGTATIVEHALPPTTAEART